MYFTFQQSHRIHQKGKDLKCNIFMHLIEEFILIITFLFIYRQRSGTLRQASNVVSPNTEKVSQ